MWKYSNGNWTWVGGNNIIDASGVYGTQGIPISSNVPGARVSSVIWTDSSGNLWLFGGYGYDSNGNEGNLNYFNCAFTLKDELMIFGNTLVGNGLGLVARILLMLWESMRTKGTPSSSNIPGGRDDSCILDRFFW